MNFLIVTHVKHCKNKDGIFAYGPYVREMNLWAKHTDQITIVAPLSKNENPDPIDLAYYHPHIRFVEVPAFDTNSLLNKIKCIWHVPFILMILFIEMWKSDHIHLRCPGNMGLLGCIMQIFYPWKKKTAKYAGNWGYEKNLPRSYQIQKAILKQSLITKNIKTLVYGDWKESSPNILPFFTASYSVSDQLPIKSRSLLDLPLVFIFVGTLTSNKNPFKAIELITWLTQSGIRNELHFYGDGPLRERITNEIKKLGLDKSIYIHGNVNADALKLAYQQSHFSILLSDSEGWPKAVAESMWWGCIPISTPVSCVPWMLDQGNRGIIADNIKHIAASLNELILEPEAYTKMSYLAMNWSRQYTLEYFEQEIAILI